MKALSLHVPWAPLCLPLAPGEKPVKTIETRAWSTKYRGPLAIHASKTAQWVGQPIGDWTLRDAGLAPGKLVLANRRTPGHECVTPLGVILGTVNLVDVVPIGEWDSFRTGTYEGDEGDYPGQTVIVNHAVSGLSMSDDWQLVLDDGASHDITDQLPYGDFTPGRWGWLFEDAVALSEPIPVKGRQRLWTLPDDVMARIEV